MEISCDHDSTFTDTSSKIYQEKSSKPFNIRDSKIYNMQHLTLPHLENEEDVIPTHLYTE